MSGVRFFQVHKDGKNVQDQVTYETLSRARSALPQAPVGAEVVEIDAGNKVIRVYSAQELHEITELKPKSAKNAKHLSKGEKWLLGVAVLAIAASFFVPEVRRRLGLEKPSPVQNQTQSDIREQKPPEEQVKTETPVTSIPIPTPKPRTKEVTRSARPNMAAGNPVKGTNNNVSSVTQGPGSIAQIGGTGNSATVYSAPPEAKLSVHYSMRELQGTGAFETAISITTDRVTPGPQLTIVCDSPCAFQSMDLGVYASMGTNRQVDDKTVEVGLSQQFNPNQTLKIVLRATTQFHIVSITKM